VAGNTRGSRAPACDRFRNGREALDNQVDVGQLLPRDRPRVRAKLCADGEPARQGASKIVAEHGVDNGRCAARIGRLQQSVEHAR